MANIKSAIKRINVTDKKTERNKIIKSRTKTAMKKVVLACSNKNKEEAKVLLGNAISQIDKACSKGIYHKNNASRKKARLAKLVNSVA